MRCVTSQQREARGASHKEVHQLTTDIVPMICQSVTHIFVIGATIILRAHTAHVGPRCCCCCGVRGILETFALAGETTKTATAQKTSRKKSSTRKGGAKLAAIVEAIDKETPRRRQPIAFAKH